jgi:uncharacterized protein
MRRDRSPWTPLGKPVVWAILVYRLTLGHLFGGCCRFHPSCSAYGLEAFRSHHPVRAAWLTTRRLLRCHPWGGSGFDPVPLYRGSKSAGEMAEPRDAGR